MTTRTKQDYFGAVLDLLAEGGAQAVTLANLCARLGVTKGSFYHHFRTTASCLSQSLEHWEATYGDDIITLARSIEGAAQRLEAMRFLASNLHHEAETAIRALARTDAHAFEVLSRVDGDRLVLIRETLMEGGAPEDLAGRLARIGLAILVGAQQLDDPVDRPLLEQLFDDYRSLMVGRFPALDPRVAPP